MNPSHSATRSRELCARRISSALPMLFSLGAPVHSHFGIRTKKTSFSFEVVPMETDVHNSAAPPTSTSLPDARRAQSPDPMDVVIEETPQTPLSDSSHSEWRAADERPAASSPIAFANTSSAEPSSRSTQLQRVVYVPISGLHNQCFRTAVARHFSCYPHQLQAIINDALAGITDAPTLASYGFSIQFDASAEAVAEVKQNYLQSSDTFAPRLPRGSVWNGIDSWSWAESTPPDCLRGERGGSRRIRLHRSR